MAKKKKSKSSKKTSLKTLNRKLDYLILCLAPLKRKDWPPIVEQAEKALKADGMLEAE
jgi:hypothetical protein